MDESTLQAMLERLGWPAERCAPHTLCSSRETREGRVSVYVRTSPEWLVLSIVPFLSTRGQNSFELARWLLRMNRDMKLAKFAYDDEGDVVLTIDLPTESLDESEVREALEALEQYAVAHRATLRAASRGR